MVLKQYMVTLIMLMSLVIFSCGIEVSSTAPEIPAVIVFSTASVAFDSVQVGSSKSLELSITNNGDVTLNVLDITTSEGEFSVTSQTSFSVNAGSSENVTVVFNPDSTGLRSGILTVESDAKNQPSTLNLSGTGT